MAGFLGGLAELGSNILGAVNSGVDYANANAQGLGAIGQGIGGLASAYGNFNAMNNANDLARQQMAMLQNRIAREQGRQADAQTAFDTGFTSSGILDAREQQERQRRQATQGLAATPPGVL